MNQALSVTAGAEGRVTLCVYDLCECVYMMVTERDTDSVPVGLVVCILASVACETLCMLIKV